MCGLFVAVSCSCYALNYIFTLLLVIILLYYYASLHSVVIFQVDNGQSLVIPGPQMSFPVTQPSVSKH